MNLNVYKLIYHFTPGLLYIVSSLSNQWILAHKVTPDISILYLARITNGIYVEYNSSFRIGYQCAYAHEYEEPRGSRVVIYGSRKVVPTNWL